MKNVLYLFLIFIFVASCSKKNIDTSNKNLSSKKTDYINLTDTLKLNHNWKDVHLGPFGQSYKLDIDANKKPYLGLHPIIQKKYKGQKKTYVCDIFQINRKLILKNDHLISTNYSSSKAEKVRNEHLRTGKNLTSDEWMLSDQFTWLTFIKEGSGSSYFKQDIFNKTLIVSKCSSFHLTVIYKNKKIVFPHYILSIPDYIFLERKIIKSKKNRDVDQLLKELKELAKEAGARISKGVVYLIDNDKMSTKQALAWWKKMFKGPKKATPENIVFLGGVCKVSIEKCGDIILILNETDDPNSLLDYWYSALKNKK